MEKNLRPVNLIMKVDPENKDTRSLVIEAKEELEKFDDPWVAVSFRHKGLEVNVRRDDEIDEIVRWVEANSLEHAPTEVQQHTRYTRLGAEYIPYISSQYSEFLNPN